MSEALKISAMAAAYDIPIVPHTGNAFTYHYVTALSNAPMCEFMMNDSNQITTLFQNIFDVL